MALPNKRGLAAIVGAVAAASLLVFTPAKEGRELKTYRDIGGVLTYCDGATENAQEGKLYTPEECNTQLDRDLARHAEGVASCVDMDALTDGQKVAFVDFAYNNGVSNFCGSTAAKKARTGDVIGSCEALEAWVCISVPGGAGDRAGPCRDEKHGFNKKYVRGLANRRAAEKTICLERSL